MIAVLQRVSQASVSVKGATISAIQSGFLILLGVYEGDSQRDTEALVNKIVSLRVFDDSSGKMNLSLLDISGHALVVSQFTLCADVSKGRRPSFIKAMPPVTAEKMYEEFISLLQKKAISVQSGKFGAVMDVALHNDGPVTIVLNSAEL